MVYADGGEEPISEHTTFGDGWNAGQCAVHEDREAAYALYRGDRRLARFGSARLLTQGAGAHLPVILGAS
jgi:hypothetical protein